MPAAAQARSPTRTKAEDLQYSTRYDPAMRLWIAEATAPHISLRALGISKAHALEILWRQVREAFGGKAS